ncbi:Vacuolar protein sorting-associated protein 62 [Sporothrix curviconia]|uniref:Vacuolar protein sorting-associated protein 62 n=1 Tax=Sporothrix curviconia TaxID=1260050 RepID=A0ABP0C5K5_9PEZI
MPSFRQLAGVLAAISATGSHAAPAPASTHSKRQSTPLPSYALTYAPISYLYSGEQWWPSDIATHMANVIPEVDYTAVAGFTAAGSVTLATLDAQSSSVYLTSKDDVDTSPAWLLSAYGKPTSTTGGYSAAPGTIIAVQKSSWVDVFYFYFYSYNYGGTVLGINFDDHVGDWEHTMIRFVDGAPTGMYFSQHSAGSAYTWSTVSKGTGANASRPLSYIGYGGHANYAKPGSEDYTIALGIISDKTDAGFAWDMAQNYRGYWYDTASGTFSEAGGNDVGATEEDSTTTVEGATWLQWGGAWGDEQYPESRSGQYCLFGECHYTSGPTGPVAKNLGRTAMCQDETDCTIFTSIDDLTHQAKKRETEE